MTKRRAKTSMKRTPSPRMSKTMHDKLRNLVERINRQIEIVEAMETANRPNSQHIVVEHRLRTVFGIMLDAQLSGLNNIAGLANSLLKQEAP